MKRFYTFFTQPYLQILQLSPAQPAERHHPGLSAPIRARRGVGCNGHNPSFKAAVKKALDRLVIIADRFHYCRYIYWALDEVRRKVQKEWHAYDRKKCKRVRHVLYKRTSKLSEKERSYLERYLGMSKELRQAYELKEAV
ncbi:transposase [Sporosarcina newyorkensis 2681]|uniref:Transposase n=1 Tax=Sporosarcina newyorkensis 2681 TaxID=1027292 RepID=F9DXV5_9BACL|nr:transposase [Sporosarcina newyorkensis 2681]